jgi:hypothetical protein
MDSRTHASHSLPQAPSELETARKRNGRDHRPEAGATHNDARALHLSK